MCMWILATKHFLCGHITRYRAYSLKTGSLAMSLLLRSSDHPCTTNQSLALPASPQDYIIRAVLDGIRRSKMNSAAITSFLES